MAAAIFWQLFLALPLLVQSGETVVIPPHGRVNSRCYPIWTMSKSQLAVVWDGSIFPVAWTFDVEPNPYRETCMLDSCVQRLWCTDSGVVGRYSVDLTVQLLGERISLDFYWLANQEAQWRTTLTQDGREGSHDPDALTWTSMFGPCTVLVVGNILYYYTWKWTGPEGNQYGLPRLSAIYFGPYSKDVSITSLYYYILSGYNILGYRGKIAWESFFTPIYPIGELGVTVSVDDYVSRKGWAIDAVVLLADGSANRELMVHSDPRYVTSDLSTSRETHTAPGYACKAYRVRKRPVCYRVPSGGRYTWNKQGLSLFDINFMSLSGSQLENFHLPSTLYIQKARSHKNDPYPVLSTFGLGAIIAFHEGIFYGAELRTDDRCRTGHRVYLVARNATGDMSIVSSSHPIGCAQKYKYPLAYRYGEVSYAATSIKWIGPYLGKFNMFVAINYDDDSYHRITETSMTPVSSPLTVRDEDEEFGGTVGIQTAVGADPLSEPLMDAIMNKYKSQPRPVRVFIAACTIVLTNGALRIISKVLQYLEAKQKSDTLA